MYVYMRIYIRTCLCVRVSLLSCAPVCVYQTVYIYVCVYVYECTYVLESVYVNMSLCKSTGQHISHIYACTSMYIVDTINKTVNKFSNNIRPFGPSKCPVYVRLPWIASPNQLIAVKVSSSVTVTCCYNAAMIRTLFTTRAAFRTIHKDVLPLFQQSNFIHKFRCYSHAIYIYIYIVHFPMS